MASDLNENKNCELQILHINLSEKYQKIAVERLSETEEVREDSLKKFKKWISENKKIISCRTGKTFTSKSKPGLPDLYSSQKYVCIVCC